MSQTAGSYIYTGPWINWSHGAVVGATITLSERDGGLLTAFLALLVSVSGAACWNILSFGLHQYRARPDAQDGLHIQQQAIFCNTSTAGGATWQLARLVWSWRNCAVKPMKRTLPLAALALLNLVLFSVAGVFSSEITKAAGNETLVRSPNCGQLDLNGTAGSQQAAYRAIDVNDNLAATTYSRACYANTQNILQCNQYIRQQLPWKSDRNATCPFSADLCVYGSTSAYEMDSGLLDSHDDLGMNAPKSDRIQYRKVTTCSPIQTPGFTTMMNVTDPNDPAYGDLLQQFAYGELSGVSNYTFTYNTHSVIDNWPYSLTYAFNP